MKKEVYAEVKIEDIKKEVEVKKEDTMEVKKEEQRMAKHERPEDVTLALSDRKLDTDDFILRHGSTLADIELIACSHTEKPGYEEEDRRKLCSLRETINTRTC